MDILNGAKLYRNKIVCSTLPHVNELCVYCLRHTFCTALNDCGVSEYYKKKLMGHTLSGSITDRVYTHTTPEKIILEAEKYTDAFDKICQSAVMEIPSDSLCESGGKLFIGLSKGRTGGNRGEDTISEQKK